MGFFPGAATCLLFFLKFPFFPLPFFLKLVVLLTIIHHNQYGFLQGRPIQDCVAWAFELIHQCQASKREIAILTLDFAKAFDTIEHAPMMQIMKCMGFDDRWLGW